MCRFHGLTASGHDPSLPLRPGSRWQAGRTVGLGAPYFLQAPRLITGEPDFVQVVEEG